MKTMKTFSSVKSRLKFERKRRNLSLEVLAEQLTTNTEKQAGLIHLLQRLEDAPELYRANQSKLAKLGSKLSELFGVPVEDLFLPLAIPHHRFIVFEKQKENIISLLRFPKRASHIYYLNYREKQDPALCWDLSIVKAFKSVNPALILARFDEEARIYSIPFKCFMETGIPINSAGKAQLAVPLANFAVFPDLTHLASIIED